MYCWEGLGIERNGGKLQDENGGRNKEGIEAMGACWQCQGGVARRFPSHKAVRLWVSVLIEVKVALSSSGDNGLKCGRLGG